MPRFAKVLLASLMVATGFIAPATAAGVTLNGKVTAVKDLSLVGATVQLEKYDADADKYTAVATATVTPSPAPTSTNAPYKFENVEDGTYRVNYPLTKADVPTSRFGTSNSVDFNVADGKISVADKAYVTIPDFKLNAMGKYSVKAIDLATNTPIQNAVFTISGSFNGEDATFASLIDPNASGTALLPVPAAGSYNIKIVDPSGMHQAFTSDDKTFAAGYSNPNSPYSYKPDAGGNLTVTVTSGANKVAGAVVHLLSADDEVAVATADQQGIASFKGLPEGDLNMWVGGPLGSPLKDSDAKLVTIVAGQTTTASQALVNGFTISGTLTSTNGAVSGARVDVEEVDADGNETPASPTETGNDGKFTTNGLGAGTYNLYFFDESSDLQDFRLTGSLLGVTITTANVPNKNVTLPSAGVVAGSANKIDGAGISATTVELINAYGDTVASSATDAKGAYRLPRITAGTYTVKFSNDGYRVSYSPEFAVEANKSASQSITLVSGSGITGKVTSTVNGQGFDGVRVSIYSSLGSGLLPVATTITQADGTYQVSGLNAGSYRIKFDASDSNPNAGVFWQPADQASSNARSFGQAGDITTRPGYTVNDVNPLPVTPWAGVTGKVTITDPTNGILPVENATVTVVSSDGLVAQTGLTDPDGNFSVAVPDGKYGIKIAAAGYSTGYVGNVADQPTLVARFADAVKVNVVQGAASFDNSWSLSNWSIDLAGNGGTVKITVLDDTKAPVTEGIVVAYNSQGNAVAFSDTCDDNGTFILSGLRGKFSFSYESAGSYAKRFVGGTSRISDAGTEIVNVTDGANLKRNLATVTLPSLALKLVTATGANAPAYADDATVEVYTYASGKWSLNADLTTTTNDGTANIGVTNGASYRIRVLPDSYLLAPVWVGAVPAANTVNDASSIIIPAVGKAPTMDNVVINVSTGVVKGHITDSSDADVSGALVQLVDSSGNVLNSTTSREDGVYNLYRVSPGKYTIKFVAEQFAVKYANNVVVAGGRSITADMIMNSASGITGHLFSTDDQPVVGATVSIYTAAGSGVTPIQTVTTNDDGTYNFIGLVFGSYKIRFDGTTADVPTSAFWYSDGENVGSFKDAGAVVAAFGEYTKNVDPQPTKSWALIKGTILDSANAVSGAAVSLVTVSLATLTGQVVTTDLTDENGNFALYAPDGSYQIQVAASGFATGYIDATQGGDAVLSASALGAAVVSVSENVAQIDGGLDTNDLTLDLSGSGGALTVTVKDDAGKTVTDGDVTVYDSTGNVAGFASGAQAGVFTIAGLSGIYRLSYAQDGVFATTYYGDTSNIADPKTKTATVNKTTKPTVTINVKALPKLTVNVVDGATPAAAFKQPVTVEVYSQVDGEWTLNDSLTQETSSGSVSFGVANGDQYRIRVVPNSDLLTPVWVGAARLAKSVATASTITIPATGAAPALGNVVMNSLAGVIDGIVSDSGLTGIPGARVDLIDNAGAVADTTTTRTDGGYHFAQILGGTYTVKFVADGYAVQYAKKYVVVAGQAATLDVKLTPASGISGRALLDGQPTAPIVGATVSVYSANGSGSTAIQTVQTDADGNYNFIGLLAGSYKVYFDNSNAEVPAESFWYGADANAATFKEAAAITATLGSYASGIDPQPVAPWTLFTGNIHDGQWAVVGGSVSLVSVSLISLSGNSALTGITDNLGNFAIYAPDGAYRVKVAAPGYLTGYVDASEVGTPILSTSAATAAVLFVSEGTLAFDSGLTNTALSLDLGASGGKIAVTVKDELGQVVTDGLVSAYDKTGKIVATDDSSVGGVFTLAGLRGYYRVSYQQDGVFAETFFGDTLSLGSAGTKTLTVTDGANIAAAIKVKTLPKLTVNIYSAGTTAYKQPVTVEVYTLSDGQWALDSGLTQETSEGVLTFGVQNLNQYRIRLVPVNPALAPVWLGANASALTVATAESILIPAAGAVPVVSGLVTVNAATISGAVTDSFQTVMSGVNVQLIAANGDVVSQTSTVEDGSYTFIQVVPGTYNFRFSAERFSDKVVRAVVVAAGAAVTQDAVLDSASGISGRVLGSGASTSLQIAGVRQRGSSADISDTPVAGATVGLYAARGLGLTALRTEVTDENGYYNFSGLVPGSYRIRIDGTTATPPAERVWYAGPDANAATFAQAQIVEAVRGELSTDVDPAPIKFWTAFDGVIKAGSLPITGATVTLSPVAKGDSFAGQTDADGFISVYAPDGDYRVNIAAAGYPGGFVSDTESGVVLDALAANATILRITDGVASFTSGLDLMADPLDLASIGGSLQVQVLDGATVLTEGVVTVYNRAGEVVAYTDSATGGVFNIDGLRGEYKVSYELPGSYALTFVGGTKVAADPKTALVKVRDKLTTATVINAVALPKFTVNVKSGNAAYAQPVTVNVFQLDGKAWKIQPDLGGTTFTGSYVFGVTRGESYRVQVVPDDLNTSNAWIGNANAVSIDTATTYAVPLTGNAPVLPSASLVPAVQVTVPLTNSRPVALENVVAHLEVTQGGKFVAFDDESLGTLESGSASSVTIARVPTSMFPIRVTGTSSNSAEVSWTSQVAPTGNITSGTLDFSEVAVLAVLSGSIKTLDGAGISGQTVTLVTDEGDEYASTQTDDSGNYSFTDLPLGVHFTVSSQPESGFLVAVGDSDFTGRSGDELEINFVQHYSVVFGGVVLDAEGNPRANALVNIYHLNGSKLDIQNDDVYSVYTDSDGNWTFDGSEFGAEVGKYTFFADGLDSDFSPAYLGNADCTSAETLPDPNTSCAVSTPDKAAVVTTSKDVQSLETITLVLGAADKTAPTGVKITKAPLATTTVTPVWQWSGNDNIDGSALRSEVVIASAAYGRPMSAWSSPIDGNATSYSINGVRGTTYCLSVRLVDKSGNASAFTAPSCTTVAMDDTALKPAKAALWSQMAVKGSFLGKVTAAKKNSKNAVLNITKAAAGKSLCIYYVTGAKFGAFTVTVNGKKLGKPVATAGKAGQIKSICYVTAIKATSKIVITVPKAGNGVQIDGYAITLAKPAAPVPPAAAFKNQK